MIPNRATHLYWIFSVLFSDDLEQKCHASGHYMKTEYTNKLIIISFSVLPMYLWIWLIAFNCLLAFLQMVETCFSKFSLLSISIPKSVTESTDVMIELFIFKSGLFSVFITAHNNCLELIWIYYHIIHFKPVNDWLTLLL